MILRSSAGDLVNRKRFWGANSILDLLHSILSLKEHTKEVNYYFFCCIFLAVSFYLLTPSTQRHYNFTTALNLDTQGDIWVPKCLTLLGVNVGVINIVTCYTYYLLLNFLEFLSGGDEGLLDRLI